MLDQRLINVPVLSIADSVNHALTESACLVITAAPGAGKSTVLPLTMLEGMVEPGMIVMLEPRRLAAKQIAERMAYLLGEHAGETVGYRIRMESRVSDRTRILVVTEGVLTRMLMDDPTLDGVAVVIFDEFHERSLVSDEALALTREVQQQLRPDLRIVLMSATIDATAIAQALAARVLHSEGRMFPVETIYQPDAELVPLIAKAHREQEGDILVFLPGEAEIRRIAEALGDKLAPTHVCPLFANGDARGNAFAIAPSRPGERKIVLATSIAETSLTIEGVRVVIDTGLCRRPIYDPNTGFSRLQTVAVSMDMADQRAGRAGRVAPGVCYRLWSRATESRMEACRQPEVLSADLSSVVLHCLSFGESQPERLGWLTPLPKGHVAAARSMLTSLGALTPNGRLTDVGCKMAGLPCEPRIATMLLQAGASAAPLAALMEETKYVSEDADQCLEHLSIRAKQIATRYAGMVSKVRSVEKSTGEMIAMAFPERVAMREGQGIFKLASGERVRLSENSHLQAAPYLAVVALSGGQQPVVLLAASLTEAEVHAMATEQDVLRWERGVLIARCERRVGSLVLDFSPAADSPSLREQALSVIAEAARKEGRSMFDFSDETEMLMRRINTVGGWHPELELPDMTIDAVLARADEWLPMYLGKATTAQEMKRIPMQEVVWSLIPYEQQQLINRLAPTHIEVPTGSRIRVDYRLGAEQPILRVRLQECFGMMDTPRLDEGRRPVLMELLSPGFKPVQLTQDLSGFWENTYFEVRKELRRRYPKHAWPDDPKNATPVRGVARKG